MGSIIKKIVLLFFVFTLSLQAHNGKNVLFIMIDDFNHWIKDIGYYEQALTPNIDALAKKGVLFADTYCSSPVCNPSRNAVFSGLRPSTTQIWKNGNNPNGDYIRDVPGLEDIVTMNQYFTENGYFTFGGGKLYHPGKMGAHDTDPDNWSYITTQATGSPGGSFYNWSHADASVSWQAGLFDLDTAGDTQLANEVAEFISTYDPEEHADNPFFIGCGLFRPHLPWNAHKDFYDLFLPDTLDIPAGYKEDDMDDLNASATEEHKTIINESVWRDGIRAYLACCSYADYNVGLVMHALNNSPHKDNTIICLLGDHGWHLGEKMRWRKFAPYDQANRTTLIIYDPSAQGNGAVCRKVVSLQDLYPTLIELTELPTKWDVEGNNLAPLLENPIRDDWDKPVLATYAGTHYIKTNKWKFVSDDDKSQLYNHTVDPHEWDNLYGKPGYVDVIANLQTKIDSIVQIGQDIKSQIVGATPEINFLFPEEDQKFDVGVNLDVEVKAAADFGTILNVSLYLDNVLVDSLNKSPYIWNASDYPRLADFQTGLYQLRAVATSDRDKKGISEITIAVGDVSTELPASMQGQDIGDAPCIGGAFYNDGIFSLQSCGADIWGEVDNFYYAAQYLTSDGEVIAKVDTMDGSDPWAKAGLMIRDNWATGARHASIFITPGNGSSFQRRLIANETSYHITPKNGLKAPCWLKLLRQGNKFSGYSSQDGEQWHLIGQDIVSIGAFALVGLAVASHNPNEKNSVRVSNFKINLNTSVEHDFSKANKLDFAINHPNPFNSSTTISYTIPNTQDDYPTSLTIYDSLGRVIRTLIKAQKEPGRHHVKWDARNNDGYRVGSGVYFYRLTVGDFQQTRKMVLLF